jgi:hypothetical protein
VKVHTKALNHGVSAEDAAQAAEWSLWIEALGDDGSSGAGVEILPTAAPR